MTKSPNNTNENVKYLGKVLNWLKSQYLQVIVSKFRQ